MSDKNNRIVELVIKHLEDGLSETERLELQTWINESPTNKEAVDTFLEEEKLQNGIKDMYHVRQKIWTRLQNELPVAKVVPIRSNLWWRYAAAVIVMLAVGLWIFNKGDKETTEINQVATNENDIKPGHEGAILTLANGKQIFLDSTGNGILAKQGNAEIIQKNGELIYHPGGAATEVVYNTLTTPKGRTYSFVLADGSKVWLNAASSITFPTSFVGNERRVEITGEAYFEVAHNAVKKFVVTGNGLTTEVLGTHFNVNSYNNENNLKITLLEGSIKVFEANNQSGGKSKILKPGQQVLLTANKELQILDNVDIEEVMAWKNGYFNFNNADIQTIMRQIDRWYDVEVVFEGNIPQRKFTGKISRQVNLSQVLKILEYSKIHFRIEGKKIIAMP